MGNNIDNINEIIEKLPKVPEYAVGNLIPPAIISLEENAKRLNTVTSALTTFSNPIVPQIVSANNYCSTIINSLSSLAMRFSEKVSSIGSTVYNILNFFNKIDYSPLFKLAELLGSFDFDKFQKKLDSIYFEALCNAKWFPHTICTSNTELFSNINDVLEKTKGASKNRIKKLDKVIFDFYNEQTLNALKKDWKEKELPNYLKRILCEAVQAYKRRQYALTLSALVPLWQGLIELKAQKKPERKTDKKTKQDLNKLLTVNDCNNFIEMFCDEYIFYQCNGLEDVIDDVPGRHSVCHSWYNKYPSRKTALNAIIFTDFLLNLQPIENEEQSNG